VLAVAKRALAALGQPNAPVGRYERDGGVKALVALYASGLTQRQLESVADQIKTDPYFAENRKRGLSSLTLEVVRRMPDTAPKYERPEEAEATRRLVEGAKARMAAATGNGGTS
jgi:hypothetical protein